MEYNQYIQDLINNIENTHERLARGDKEVLKNDLRHLKRDNQRTYDAKVEEKIQSLAKGPLNFGTPVEILKKSQLLLKKIG